MTTISELPGMYTYIRRMIVEERKTHRDVSRELKRAYPMINRGLSERSVARFCETHYIHATSRIDDQTLDNAVRGAVGMVSIYNFIAVMH